MSNDTMMTYVDLHLEEENLRQKNGEASPVLRKKIQEQLDILGMILPHLIARDYENAKHVTIRIGVTQMSVTH